MKKQTKQKKWMGQEKQTEQKKWIEQEKQTEQKKWMEREKQTEQKKRMVQEKQTEQKKQEEQKRRKRFGTMALALCLILILCLPAALAGCGAKQPEYSVHDEFQPESSTSDDSQPESSVRDESHLESSACDESRTESSVWDVSAVDHSMELQYADQFSVDYYPDGTALITIRDSGKYLVIPENCQLPQGLPEDIAVIRRPLKNIYLAATSAMDLFSSLGGLEAITLSGTAASGWYIEEARQAMEAGNMVYAGKYSAPDYELILSKNCDLAVESTMIYHSPEVKEQLERLGIPVLVERSSYESHPLGRMEWLRLYGVLLDREEQADDCLKKQWKQLEPIMEQEATGKTVAFFYVTSNGSVNVRKSGDYVAKIIGLAGGVYVPQKLDEGENALSTMNLQMEAFYAAAKDADYIIYNSTIDGELNTMDELLAKSGLLADFKAVKEGHVWCTGKNLFHETMGLGDMILDIHRLLTEENPQPEEMIYLHPVQSRE